MKDLNPKSSITDKEKQIFQKLWWMKIFMRTLLQTYKCLLLKYSLKVLSFQQFYKLWQIGLNKKQFFSFPSIKDCAKGSIQRSRSYKESMKRISTKDTYDSWNECLSLNNDNWTIKHLWRPQWSSLWRETWLVQDTPAPNFNNRLHSKSYKTSGASFYLRIQWILRSSMWPLTR